ncbi:MAG: PD40 domain-containing protein, partial [Bacteroidia bacterium]|nr:PD40 domain-containing protein [Bacteroidia bacterium]
NVEYYADIGVSTRHGRTWQKPVLLPEKINTKQYEGSACISLDGNTLYFSSNRKEGSGGSDIWMVKKEAAGDWGSPVNLGSSINTVYDEDDPFITMDGNTLYFSSKGHNSMGGYDIFKSKRNPVTNTWSPAVNAGYPLNTTDDNTTISFTGDERYAWISCVRPDGLGDKDVWQVEYMDTLDHPFRTLIKGTVAPSAGGRIELTSVTLENQSDHTRMEYRPAGATKEFVLSALPGEYTLKVEGYNFAPYSENITIGNEFPPVPVIKNITVQSAK